MKLSTLPVFMFREPNDIGMVVNLRGLDSLHGGAHL